MEITALAATTQKSSAALSQLTGNLDSFLTLLTTQLKNQDPLDPLDTEKFTSQLVQFAGVEQSIETNRLLETLIGLQAAADRDGALAMIGKTVMIDGGKAANSGAGATWTYDLPKGAANVRMTILDEAGRPVAQFAGDPSAGSHSFNWDGKRADGAIATKGVYTLVIDAKEVSGGVAPFTLQSAVRIESVAFGIAGAELETGIGPVAFSAVKRVMGA